MIESESFLIKEKINNSKFLNSIYKKRIRRKVVKNNFIISDEGTLIEYKGNESEIIIPEGVIKLKNALFWKNTKIKKVVFPISLQFLGGDTFYGCINLKEIVITKNIISIGDNPFADCPKLELVNKSANFVYENGALYDKDKTRLIYFSIKNSPKSFVTPPTLISIGKHAFYNCHNIKQITLSENIRIIENNPFSNLPQLKLINNSKHFKFIEGALYNASLTTLFYYEHSYDSEILNIPNKVRIIGRHSFYNCKTIKKIVIPKSVEIIGYNPFARCSNLTIKNYSPNYIYENECLYTKDKKELIYHNSSSKIKKMIISDGVEKIGRSAFFDCIHLEEIILPKTIKIIERSAFAGCKNLKMINMPRSIENIGDWAFLGCDNLNLNILNKMEN